MDSPYHACQAVLVTGEFSLGCGRIKYNPFRWYEVVLNLTGDPSFQLNISWVYKMR